MSSSTDTSFSILYDNKKTDVSVYKYIDIDSTYRNRKNYPNPNDFVIPINFPGRNNNTFNPVDPVSDALPYTASSVPVGSNTIPVIGTFTTTQISLNPAETNINNYYVNSYLQLMTSNPTTFVKIIAYDGLTKIATIIPPPPPVIFNTPVAGEIYYTRKIPPFYTGQVSPLVPPNPRKVQIISSGASNISGIYVNNYIKFITGANNGLIFLVTAYDGATKILTLASDIPFTVPPGQPIELDTYSRDNASTLSINSNHPSTNTINNYYELELLWLSMPNQLLNVGYGGTIDAYPYVYVEFYNEGKNQTNQIFFSNNPHTTKSIFKVPIDQYNGTTSFFTFVNCKTKHVIRFEPDQDLRFRITLPDGSIVQYNIEDTVSPNAPDPRVQVSALFSMRKATSRELTK